MSETRTLLTVEYHTDTETGIHSVGEVDFGIHGMVDKFLELYGREGKDDIVKTLAYLIYAVESRFSSIVSEVSAGQATP